MVNCTTTSYLRGVSKVYKSVAGIIDVEVTENYSDLLRYLGCPTGWCLITAT